MASVTFYLDPMEATAFASSALQSVGVPVQDASIIANCLVQADLRGVSSHGLMRLQQYIARAQSGLVNTKPDIKIRDVTQMVAQLDGDNGFGFVVATEGMKQAILRAETYGISMVTVNKSNHFGMAASYVLQAISAGKMAFVFSNSSKTMAAYGSKEPLFGTSPFAVGAPSEREIPFVLDMAPSVVAKGKIRAAMVNGAPIPEGWAVDEHGRPTTDAIEAMKGMVVPIGGAKGSGLAMLMDIMAGVLSGSAFAGEVGDQYKDQRPQDVGHCFIVIKPDVLLEPGQVRARMDTLVLRLHSCVPAAGFDEVLTPGEPEYRLSAIRSVEGIPYGESAKKMMEEVANSTSTPLCTFSTTPLHSAR